MRNYILGFSKLYIKIIYTILFLSSVNDYTQNSTYLYFSFLLIFLSLISIIDIRKISDSKVYSQKDSLDFIWIMVIFSFKYANILSVVLIVLLIIDLIMSLVNIRTSNFFKTSDISVRYVILSSIFIPISISVFSSYINTFTYIVIIALVLILKLLYITSLLKEYKDSNIVTTKYIIVLLPILSTIGYIGLFYYLNNALFKISSNSPLYILAVISTIFEAYFVSKYNGLINGED